MTVLLARRGRPLAVLGARRYYLAPSLDERDDDDHERRTVDALCRLLIGATPRLPALDAAARPQLN
jgi:hypothetical protein